MFTIEINCYYVHMIRLFPKENYEDISSIDNNNDNNNMIIIYELNK